MSKEIYDALVDGFTTADAQRHDPDMARYRAQHAAAEAFTTAFRAAVTAADSKPNPDTILAALSGTDQEGTTS